MLDNIKITIVRYDEEHHNILVKFSDGVDETPVYNFQPYKYDLNLSPSDLLKKIGLSGVEMLKDIKNKKTYSSNSEFVDEIKTFVNNPQTFTISELYSVEETFEVSI
jgi:hypothetical protein